MSTDLDDDDEEQSHVSSEVNFMELKHRSTETKYQSANDDLDGLQEEKKEEEESDWKL